MHSIIFVQLPNFKRTAKRTSRSGVRFVVLMFAFAAFVAPLSAVRLSIAQEPDALAEARSNFQRAVELEQASNFAAALKLFREVGSVKMTPQVRYHIATCEERLGQLVAALGGYELAMSTGSDMPPDFVSEVQAAIDQLEARIPRLVIERGQGAEAAAIELDGVTLGQSSLGVEIPLNPGPHHVIAHAAGYLEFDETITVAEGSVEKLSVELTPEPAPEEPPPPPPTVVEPRRRFGYAPYIVGGSGLLVSIVGGTLLGVSQVNVGKIKDICGGIDCSGTSEAEQQRAKRLEKSARSIEASGWVTLGVGAAALCTGVVMMVMDAKPSRETAQLGKPRTKWVPLISPTAWGVSMSRSF